MGLRSKVVPMQKKKKKGKLWLLTQEAEQGKPLAPKQRWSPEGAEKPAFDRW